MNMVEKLKKLIEKFGLWESIKSIGGFGIFLEIVDKHPQLRPYLDELKGSCSVSDTQAAPHPDAYFDFYILNVEILDDDFAVLTVDMVVDFKNLSGEEIYHLKRWFVAVSDDYGFEIYDVDSKIPTHQNLYIKSFNGIPYTFEGYAEFISDSVAFDLLDKTGKWEGMIR